MGHVCFMGTRRNAWSPLAIVSLWSVNILVVLPFDHPFDTGCPDYPHIFLFHNTGLLLVVAMLSGKMTRG